MPKRFLFNPTRLKGDVPADPHEYQQKTVEHIAQNQERILKYWRELEKRRALAPEKQSKTPETYFEAHADFQAYRHLKKREILKIQKMEEFERQAQKQQVFTEERLQKQQNIDEKTDKSRRKRLRRKQNKSATSSMRPDVKPAEDAQHSSDSEPETN